MTESGLKDFGRKSRKGFAKSQNDNQEKLKRLAVLFATFA
jgi:hypothetical protein